MLPTQLINQLLLVNLKPIKIMTEDLRVPNTTKWLKQGNRASFSQHDHYLRGAVNMTQPSERWVWRPHLWREHLWCTGSWSSACHSGSVPPITCLSRSLAGQSGEVGQIFQSFRGHNDGLWEHTVSFVAPAYSNYINLHAREKWMVITALTGAQGHVFIREIPPRLWSKVIYSSWEAK